MNSRYAIRSFLTPSALKSYERRHVNNTNCGKIDHLRHHVGAFN